MALGDPKTVACHDQNSQALMGDESFVPPMEVVGPTRPLGHSGFPMGFPMLKWDGNAMGTAFFGHFGR